jgi:hypothetical protein
MDKYRLSHKNKITEEIKQITTTMERDVASMSKIKNSNFDLSFIENSIKKITDKIEEKKNKKKELEEKLRELESGNLDDKIQSEYKQNKTEITIKNDDAQKKRNIIAVQKAEDVEKSKIQYKHSREVNNSIKQGNRDVKYYEKRFFNSLETLPPYIERNLNDMSNNKGYLWKGIMFFGKINNSEADCELMIFDKQNKDNLIIHEWTEKDLTIYKKIGKNPKTIISSKPRHIIEKYGTLSDFIQTKPELNNDSLIVAPTITISRGVSDRGRGVSNRGRGVSDRGRGVSDRGRGVSDRGRGVSDRGRGVSDRGRGVSDRGRGVSDIDIVESG